MEDYQESAINIYISLPRDITRREVGTMPHMSLPRGSIKIGTMLERLQGCYTNSEIKTQCRSAHGGAIKLTGSTTATTLELGTILERLGRRYTN